MHRSIAGRNTYHLFSVTMHCSKNLTTSLLLTLEHMVMFVVNSIHIHINSPVMDISNFLHMGQGFPYQLLVLEYKYLSCIPGVDGKIHPEGVVQHRR